MMPKIRIAYLIDTISSDKAGTEKQLLNIVNQINKNMFEVVLVCLHETRWMRENSIPVRCINLGYKGIFKTNIFGVVRRLAALIDQEKFDIMQTFFEESIYVALLGRTFSRHKPVLLSSRRDLGLGVDEPFYHMFFKGIKPLVMKLYDGIVVNAEAVKGHVIRYEAVRASKVAVILNGLDIPESLQEMPSTMQAHPGSIWIGIVANLKPIKRIDLFIDALACLKHRFEDVNIHGIVLGDGHLLGMLESKAKESGIGDRLHLAGACSNVNDYLQHIDIGVLCSDKEGLSNAILEYMANGLPVVATAVGGNSELVDGRNGICVPPGDATAIADALAVLIGSPELRKTMGDQSLQKVRNNHVWSKVMPQWENFYTSLVTVRNEVVSECVHA